MGTHFSYVCLSSSHFHGAYNVAWRHLLSDIRSAEQLSLHLWADPMQVSGADGLPALARSLACSHARTHPNGILFWRFSSCDASSAAILAPFAYLCRRRCPADESLSAGRRQRARARASQPGLAYSHGLGPNHAITEYVHVPCCASISNAVARMTADLCCRMRHSSWL